MTTPLISILIPTYNSAKTLRAALDSVVTQSLQDWEIVLIDGESKDGTLSIVQEYAGADPRIRSVSEPDKGIYDAMNKGVAMAHGEWLYFLGSDDTFHDAAVLSFFEPDLRAGVLDMVYGDIVTGPGARPYDGPFDAKKILSKNFSHQAAFYRRRTFARIGGFNLAYRAYADWEFNIRCLLDPGLRIEYRARVVATFGMDGVSRRHDTAFLREMLIPLRLQKLQTETGRPLRNIGIYDDWWRMIRNAGVRSEEDLPKFLQPLPRALSAMIRAQSAVSPRTLEKGIFSKVLMSMSYCRNLLAGVI